MFSAVNYLHQIGICHRDIKLDNFLLSNRTQKKIKLIDFGQSQFFDTQDPNVEFQSVVGDPGYVAPDVINGNYDCRCDIWSMGVIMFVVLTGELPFVDVRGSRPRVKKVLGGEWHRGVLERDGVSDGAKDLIRKILVVDPVERIGISEILGHQWFEGVRDQILEAGRDLLDIEVFKRFELWGSYSKFQRILYKVIVGIFYEEPFIEKWEKLFSYMDLDSTGKFFV